VWSKASRGSPVWPLSKRSRRGSARRKTQQNQEETNNPSAVGETASGGRRRHGRSGANFWCSARNWSFPRHPLIMASGDDRFGDCLFGVYFDVVRMMKSGRSVPPIGSKPRLFESPPEPASGAARFSAMSRFGQSAGGRPQGSSSSPGPGIACGRPDACFKESRRRG